MTKKWFMSPYNWVIYPLTQTQVANQQQQQKKNLLTQLKPVKLMAVSEPLVTSAHESGKTLFYYKF